MTEKDPSFQRKGRVQRAGTEVEEARAELPASVIEIDFISFDLLSSDTENEDLFLFAVALGAKS